MKSPSAILATALVLALGSSCGPAEVSGTAYYSAPDLAYVSPGVQVVADYDYPVFYADNFYWRFYDGGWYRSPYYYGGWISISSPPYAVARIDRPWAYSHYRGTAYYPRTVDHRAYRPTYAPRGGYNPRPVPRGMRVPMGRDHRR